MKQLLFALAALPLLSACSTFSDIDDGLDVMRGHPVDDLIGILGYPDAEQSVAGRRFVIWSTERTVSGTTPVTNYNYGTMSGTSGFNTLSSTSTVYMPTTYNYDCTIKVEVDQANRIVGHNFDGNIGGCERYSRAIRKALPQI